MLHAQLDVVAEKDDRDAAKNTVGLSRLYPRVTGAKTRNLTPT